MDLPSPRYIHERPGWPRFTWNHRDLVDPLAAVRHRQGRLIGRMEALGFELRREAVMRTLTQDALKTSQIEGEHLDKEQVRSSVARHLGVDIAGLKQPGPQVEGVVEMMLDATQRHDRPLTAERIFDWHASLFPTGRSGLRSIRVGSWRDDAKGPMQVVSGPIGRERVHFEAPAADRIVEEVAGFLAWFNSRAETDEVLRAALAHLWFVTLHPLDDGNGRVARAVADMLLARSESTSQRFYSMSAQIERERSDYYGALERAQKGTLNTTEWMLWFLRCLRRAIDSAESTLGRVIEKSRFWDSARNVPINVRQRLMLNRLLDGFEGKLTTSKWAKICKVSNDSALRDISELIAHGVLVRGKAGGRSTSYELVLSVRAASGTRTESVPEGSAA